MERRDTLSPVPEAAREGTPDAAIYDAIYGAVMERRLLPGARLTEASLCEIFGVSRAAVRLALLRLSHDRIVTLTPNRGAAISRPTVRETREVFEMRRLIETAAMQLVVERALPRDVEALRELVHQEHAAFERGDLRRWTRLSGEFHLRLLAATGNGVLSEAGRDLVTRSLLMSTLYMPPGQPSCASHEHEHLIEALAAGEGKRAARLMGAHLQACEARLHLDAPEAAAPDLAAALGVPPGRPRAAAIPKQSATPKQRKTRA